MAPRTVKESAYATSDRPFARRAAPALGLLARSGGHNARGHHHPGSGRHRPPYRRRPLGDQESGDRGRGHPLGVATMKKAEQPARDRVIWLIAALKTFKGVLLLAA